MKQLIFIALGICVLTQYSCKKVQPDLSNKGCDCAHEVSAGFTMGQEFMGNIIDLDTIHYYPTYEYVNGNLTSYLNGNCFVSFSANIKNATSYEWQVGESSTIKTTKEFGLYFSDTVGTIQVRLIVHSKPNKICFPNDDGIDTVIRNLTIISMEKPYLIGKYYGSNIDTPNEKFYIKIDTATMIFSNFSKYINYCIFNLPLGNTHDGFSELNSVSFSGWDNWDNDNIQVSNSMQGYYDRHEKKITINYSAVYFNANNQIIKQLDNKTFVGIKMN